MKRLPFFDDSFVLRIPGSDKIVSVLNLRGGEAARIVNLDGDRVFIITSRTAHQIARLLVSDPDGKERLAYATGYRFANILTLDHFVLLDTNNSSSVHVDPDAESRFEALDELDRYGLALHGLFHNHPVSLQANEDAAKVSVTPSPTDLSTMRTLEARYGAIGAICNKAGFMQFFSASQMFRLLIVGKGIEDYGLREDDKGFRHLIRLTEFHSTAVPAAKGGFIERIAHRAARALSLV